MTIVATPIAEPGAGNSISAFGDVWNIYFSLAFSGNYVTGGDTFDPRPFYPNGLASQVMVCDVAGGAQYNMEYQKATQQLKVFSAAGTELAAGAYPAALTGNTNVVAQVQAR